MERRREDRFETNVMVHCRAPALPRRGIMTDASSRGCRLRVPMVDLQVGSTVLLELPGTPRFPGTVQWLNGIDAGVRFDRPLGRATSIALGMDDPDPDPDPELEPAQFEPSAHDGLLRHWKRRIAAAFG